MTHTSTEGVLTCPIPNLQPPALRNRRHSQSGARNLNQRRFNSFGATFPFCCTERMNRLTGELPQALAVLPGSSPLFPPSAFLSHRTLNGSGDVENGNLCKGGMLLFFLSSSSSANRPAKRKISCFPSLILPGANIHEEETREKKKRRRERRQDTRLSGSGCPWPCYCRSSNWQLNLEEKRKVAQIFLCHFVE